MNEGLMQGFQQRLQSRQDPVFPPTLWAPLDVRNAAGGLVNMDYYAVRVRLLSGTDPAVLLNGIRKNINSFVDTHKSSFAPYPDVEGNRGNAARWNSNRPTGSFVTIDIPVNDGTVAVIDSGADHWTFATVQSPRDGLHPVSGNRQFGYTDNGDGTVTFSAASTGSRTRARGSGTGSPAQPAGRALRSRGPMRCGGASNSVSRSTSEITAGRHRSRRPSPSNPTGTPCATC